MTTPSEPRDIVADALLETFGNGTWDDVIHDEEPWIWHQRADAVLAALDLPALLQAARAEALNAAADALEGMLGVAGAPKTLWEFRQWLRVRARAEAHQGDTT